MSADRDYWTELKQLLRWFITPGLPPRLVLLVRACLARPAHAAYLGSYQFVRACPGSSELVQDRPARFGTFRLIRACAGSSGLIQHVWACPSSFSWSGLLWLGQARRGSSGLVRARLGSLRPGLGPQAGHRASSSLATSPGSSGLVRARPGSSGLVRARVGPSG